MHLTKLPPAKTVLAAVNAVQLEDTNRKATGLKVLEATHIVFAQHF